MYKTIAFQLMGRDKWLYTNVSVRQGELVFTAEEAFEYKLKERQFIYASLNFTLELGFGMVRTQFIVAYKEVVTA